MSNPGRRSVLNCGLLGLHFALYVVAPSIGAIAALNHASRLDWSPTVAGWMRVVLFFLVLPVYFIYMGIALPRVFPRRPLPALATFVPAASSLASVLAGGDLGSASLVAMRSGLPLLVGFMTLLVLGVVVLILREGRGKDDVAARAAATVALLAAGYGPVVYLAALHLGLGIRDGHGVRFTLQFVAAVTLVAVFHLRPIRQLYDEGAL